MSRLDGMKIVIEIPDAPWELGQNRDDEFWDVYAFWEGDLEPGSSITLDGAFRVQAILHPATEVTT